jgi:ribosomal protein S18 acetylase RimI-like enzyme
MGELIQAGRTAAKLPSLGPAEFRTKMSHLKCSSMVAVVIRAGEQGGHNNALLGFIAYRLGEDEESGSRVGYIYELHVTQQLHGNGVGTGLLRVAESNMRAKGLESSWLTVHTANKGARRLYTYLGYGGAQLTGDGSAHVLHKRLDG